MHPLKLAIAAAPLGALLLTACGSSGPPATCGIAVQAADYAMGHNGTQDASNDLRAASALRHAAWPTAVLRADADRLASAFASFSTQDEPGYELASTGISGGIHRLLGACKR
jgi:hypothetical protein